MSCHKVACCCFGPPGPRGCPGAPGASGASALIGNAINVPISSESRLVNGGPPSTIAQLLVTSKKQVNWLIQFTVGLHLEADVTLPTIEPGTFTFSVVRNQSSSVPVLVITDINTLLVSNVANDTRYQTISLTVPDAPPGNPGQTIYSIQAQWAAPLAPNTPLIFDVLTLSALPLPI